MMAHSWGKVAPMEAARQHNHIYLDYYHLKSAPFTLTPDPEFLYHSLTHRNAIDTLLYGIECRMGFMMLTGEVGTGKTTICRMLLDRLDSVADTVYIINPSMSGHEIISCILEDLGLSPTKNASKKELIDQLNGYLLSVDPGRPVVILIDDAQTMPTTTLEALRLLSNLETDKRKMLQIILVGQSELIALLSRQELRQLKQRISIIARIDDLNCEEVESYIHCRLFIAGNKGQLKFSPKTIKRIHRFSNGIPRQINKLCDYALIAGFSDDASVILPKHLNKAMSEVADLMTADANSSRGAIPKKGLRAFAACVSAFMLILTGLGGYWYSRLTQAENAAFTWFKQHEPESINQDSGVPANGVEERSTTSPDRGSLSSFSPFILMLGSYNTLDTTLRAVSHYQKQGIKTHWNRIDLREKGLWYRVYAGRYPDQGSALEFKSRRQLKDAKVVRAPWTVSVGRHASKTTAKAISVVLTELQIDHTYLETDEGERLLVSGAFVSKEGAEDRARQLSLKTSIACKAVRI